MNDTRYPVTVAVTHSDGSVEHVRVGTAVRRGDGFALQLGELAIGAAPEPARRGASSAPPAYTGGGAGAPSGMVFPPYGRSKGAPIAGATTQDLEFYASGCRRTLADPGKSRWHDKEKQLLAAIEAELARQGGGGGGGGQREWNPGGSGPRSSEPPAYDDDAPPPRGDEDLPF
jgi:hypothetical protein